jgi:hypothetical protein
MQKFVIKDRIKRKYVRRTKAVRSFSFSKTAYGMVPVVIMMIAFGATVVISTSFREFLTHFTFSFRMPQITFSYQVNNTAVLSDITNLTKELWEMILAIFLSITGFFAANSETAFRLLLLLDPRPLYLAGDGMFVMVVVLLKDLYVLVLPDCAVLFFASLHFLSIAENYIASLFATVRSVIVYGFLILFQIAKVFAKASGQTAVSKTGEGIHDASNFIFYLGHMIIFACGILMHCLIFAGMTISYVFQQIMEAIFISFNDVTDIIITAVRNASGALIHVIEIPFNILAAYWIVLRPYVLIFNRHVQMSEIDLSKSFVSLLKIGSFLHA